MVPSTKRCSQIACPFPRFKSRSHSINQYRPHMPLLNVVKIMHNAFCCTEDESGNHSEGNILLN